MKKQKMINIDPYFEFLKYGKEKMLIGDPWFSLNSFLVDNPGKYSEDQVTILDDLTGNGQIDLLTRRPTTYLNNRNREFRINDKGYLFLFEADQIELSRKSISIATKSLLIAITTMLLTIVSLFFIQ